MQQFQKQSQTVINSSSFSPFLVIKNMQKYKKTPTNANILPTFLQKLNIFNCLHESDYNHLYLLVSNGNNRGQQLRHTLFIIFSGTLLNVSIVIILKNPYSFYILTSMNQTTLPTVSSRYQSDTFLPYYEHLYPYAILLLDALSSKVFSQQVR